MKFKCITLSLAFVSALSLKAQEQSRYTNFADTIFDIDEIVVSAKQEKPVEISKLNVPLKFMPVSANTVSSQTFETRGITNLQDAVKFLPGTRMRTTYGAYQQFQVRGFDYTPIMIDGIRDERTSITNSAPLPDLSSVESIELLKGPASVLYGHSTVGGILNLVRKAPTEETVVNALISYGSWDNKRAMIDFGGKLAGPFNYRTIINMSDVEGYRYTNDQRFSGYFALGAKFDEKQELDIRGGFNRDKYGTEIGLPDRMTDSVYNTDNGSLHLAKGEMPPGLNPRWRYNNESDFMKNYASNVSIKYNYNFKEAFKLENRIAYNYDNIDYFSTEALTYLTSNDPIYDHYYMAGGTKKYICLDTVQLTYPLRFAYTVHTINEQIEASGKITFDNGMKYNYLTGYNYVYFFRNTYRGYNGINPETGKTYTLDELIDGPGLYSKVPVYNPHSMGYMDPYFSAGTKTRNYTHSVYLQNLFELSDQFKIMISGRFDHFTFKTATASITRSKEREYTECPPLDKTTTSAFTYRVGAVYLPLPDLSVYGSFANFFMPYRDIVNTATTVYIDADGNRFHPASGEEAFKAQEGYQAEIGARYSISNKLQVTASGFYIRKDNEKKTLNSSYVDSEDGNKKSVVGQVATSDSKGFELELSYTPASNAMFSIGYAYTNAKIRKFSFSPEKLIEEGYMDKNTDTQNGMRLAGIPVNTFFAAGNYTIIKGIFKKLGFTGTVSYMDNVLRDLNKTVIYPAYWDTDMGISYKLNNGIELRANVYNIFDDRHFIQSLGTQITPRTPRNYLLTIAYSL